MTRRSLLLLALLGGCDDAATDPTADPAPLVMARDTELTYVLAWSWEGARREGDAWVFETDLGYTVGISSAHVATGTIALVPCVDDSVTTTRAHGGTPDASTAAGPLAESLLSAAPLRFGAAKASGADYCELHLLSVPSEDLPADDGFVLARQSLALTGFWSAPGSEERHALAASVNLSDGRVLPLSGAVQWPDAAPEGEVALVVTRRPARGFDGLALEELSAVELAFEALGGILQSAEVSVARR